MNLSHPNFLAFLRRLEASLRGRRMKIFLSVNLVMGAYFLFSSRCPGFLGKVLEKTGVSKMIGRGKNLLALMEDDIGTFFQLLDDCVKQHIFDHGFMKIGNYSYQKVVLTPLLMDFGNKNMADPCLHYNRKPVQKPVVEQVIDVFNGIKDYLEPEKCSSALEIYPFLGINTANYSLGQIKVMLEKYFGSYRGAETDFLENLGSFDGDVEHLAGNSFSGIKVYPPLGFDPWPDDRDELLKVEFLYDYCSQKQIPITTHCSDGGFCVIDTESALMITSPSRWEGVLKKYGKLKLNFGHFGNGTFSKEWSRVIIDLIGRYDNVYTDFSYRGFNNDYYSSLKKLIDNAGRGVEEKLRERILFGSDFLINLIWMDSYCQYLKIFSENPYFSGEEKNIFCSVNPQHFLFQPERKCLSKTKP